MNTEMETKEKTEQKPITNDESIVLLRMLLAATCRFDADNRMRLVKNIRRLRNLTDDLEAMRISYVKELLKPGETQLAPNSVAFLEFQTKYRGLLVSPANIKFKKIPLSVWQEQPNDASGQLIDMMIGRIIPETDDLDDDGE